MQAEEN